MSQFYRVILSEADALELLGIDPDNFTRIAPLSEGIYRAMWRKYNPELQLMLLTTNPRVEIVREAYHPDHLPSWTAIEFAILEEAADVQPNT